MLEPSRTIFIVTMLLAGVGVLVGTWFLARAIDRRRFVVAMTVFGVGLVGIGIFPGNVEGFHPLFALLCFVGGSVAAIMSRKVIVGTFRHFAVALGTIALVATVFGSTRSSTGGRRPHWAAAASSGGSPIRCCCGSSASAPS